MQVRPKPWSHHHAHRLFHISMGICFAFVVLAIVTGMVAVWLRAQANTDPKTELVHITAMVGGINPGPISSGGGFFPVIPPPTEAPNITIYAELFGQVPQKPLVVGQQTVPAYAFTVPNPAFSGQASVPNSMVFLSVQGPQNLNSTALANNAGSWFWQSPQDFPPGTYLITATVYNPNDLSKHGSASVYFTIEPKPGTGSSNGVNPPPSVVVPPGPGNQLFGVFFEVLKNYEQVTAGHKVVGSLTLVSNYSGKEIENQVIEYLVKDEDGTVIMESKDTVSFSKITRFLKTILTAPGANPGIYTVIVKSTFRGVESIAPDTFILQAALPDAANLAGGSVATTSTILWSAAVGLALLFLLLVLAAYYQVRLVSRHINEHNDRWHNKKEL